MRDVGLAAFEYRLPLADIRQRLADLGVATCELVYPEDIVPGTAAAARHLLAEAGVEVTAVATRLKVIERPDAGNVFAELSEVIGCAQLVGAPAIIIYVGVLGTRSSGPISHNESIARCAQLLRRSLELAQDAGVDVLIENHFAALPGEPTSSWVGCRDILAALDSTALGINFDGCNFVIAGEDPLGAYTELKPAIRNVHLKDAIPYDPERDGDYRGRVVEDATQGQFMFVELGAGMSQSDELLALLAREGTPFPMTLEAHTAADLLDHTFRHGLTFCRSRLGWRGPNIA